MYLTGLVDGASLSYLYAEPWSSAASDDSRVVDLCTDFKIPNLTHIATGCCVNLYNLTSNELEVDSISEYDTREL